MLRRITDLIKQQHYKSINRAIFLSILSISVVSFGGKLVSMLKEMLVASYFGTGDLFDAFLIALLLPFFFIGVVGYSFTGALIPTAIQTRLHEGKEKFNQLTANTLSIGLFLLLTITFLLVFSGPALIKFIASGFTQQKYELTVTLFYQILPLLTLQGIAILFGSLIETEKRFAMVVLIPTVTPLSIIVIITLWAGQIGIQSLVLGTLIGGFFEAALLGLILVKMGIRIVPGWYGLDQATLQVMKQYLPIVAGAFMMSSTLIVDQAMASMLEPGSVSSLSYANRIISLILSLSAVAVGKAVLPYFSEMTAAKDWNGIQDTLKKYLFIIVIGSVLVVAVISLFSTYLVGFLFERGEFSQSDTRLVTEIFLYYSLQVPSYISSILIVNLVSSLKANKILFYGSLLNLIANIGLNYLFIYFLGVAGIALSTSFVYFISAGFLLVMVKIKIKSMQQNSTERNV